MRRGIWTTVIVIFLILLFFGSSLARFYTDWLWFVEVGYKRVFFTRVLTKGAIGGIAALLFFAVVYTNLWLARRLAPPVGERRIVSPFRRAVTRLARAGITLLIFGGTLAVSILVGIAASRQWFDFLCFLNATPFKIEDPIFHNDIAFYIFKLGFLRYVYTWLLSTLVVSLIATAAMHYSEKAVEFYAGQPAFAPHVKTHLFVLFALILFVRAWGYRLDVYKLLYSPTGVVYGAGYTDIHVRLLVINLLAIASALGGIVVLFGIYRRGIKALVATVIGLVGISFVLGVLLPPMVQQFVVKPDEFRKETPFIKYNIAMTRRAFALDKIRLRSFPALDNLTAKDIQENQATISSIRLWDYRPIQATYNQMQALWQFYEIENVDIDRYVVGDQIRQVMLAARELSPNIAMSKSGTWVNEHFQYTHGYGAVMSPVNKATEEGLPEFFVQDIPPTSAVGIEITRPQIYYGELTYNYVVVNSRSKEFDYPAANKGVYTRYEGNGGIPIGTYLRRLAFAWRFGDMNLILPNPTTSKSRLMFRREITERVRTIFPYLQYDPDPYLVIADGRLFWIIDAYTLSHAYPYSTPTWLTENQVCNYIRNSVKVVVDAYQGTVDFYIADPADPIVNTYAKIFPGAFKPIEQMPDSLRAHIRYPELLFRAQSHILSTYHMRDPQVFYNKSDQWAVPKEIVGVEYQPAPMEPYYVVMRLPGEKNEQFILMRPFTPQKKSNMVAWLAGRCGPDRYGELILYEFPEGKRIFGPEQIESRINQDPVISAQLTLWGREGSRVNRGNLLVIPIGQSLLYLKPLYLESETTKIPELRLVVLAYRNRIVAESTLEKALARVFGGQVRESEAVPKSSPRMVAPTAMPLTEIQALADEAYRQLERAQELQRRGDWSGYGEQMQKLQQTLARLRQASSGR